MAITGYFNYTARSGETWDAIAFKNYQVERMSHYIINANLQYIDRVIFEGGEVLKIPIVTELEAPASLPPWRR